MNKYINFKSSSIIMKHQLILATAVVVAMTGCTKESFMGLYPEQSETAIVFSNANSAITKANTIEGKDAAEKLGNSFVVYGKKYFSTGDSSIVFDHYNVEFKDGTATSTPSNFKGWEYSNITPVCDPNHSYTTTKITGNFTSVTAQSIKYWDNKASQYRFIAFSRGKGAGTPVAYATFTAVDATKIGTSDPVYTASGTVDQLAEVYIADIDTVKNENGNFVQNKPVTPKFRSTSAKIRVGFYETVPGYSIKSLTFYDGSNLSTDNKVVLSVVDGSESLPAGSGELKVYMDKKGKASCEFVKDNTDATKKTEIIFDNSIVLGAAAEKSEGSGNYLGRASNTASYTNSNKELAYYNILPPSTPVALKVKVGYTLLSIDGKKEEIVVDPVETTIPVTYTSWKSNTAYTYIFKISDHNLQPITLDAVITESDSIQETVSELIVPSITTYAKGKKPTVTSEYRKDTAIYVSVNGKTILSDLSNVKLYKVTIDDASGACQGITEASVANCLAKGTQDPTGTWTVTDLNGKTLTVTTTNILSYSSSIAAADAPNGTAISGNFAMFKPTTTGTYAFEFTDSDSKKYYKIIVVTE